MKQAEAFRVITGAGYTLARLVDPGPEPCSACGGSGLAHNDELFPPACGTCGGRATLEGRPVLVAVAPVDILRWTGQDRGFPVRFGAERWLWHGCTIEPYTIDRADGAPTTTWLVVDLDGDGSQDDSYMAATRRQALEAVVHRKELQ